MDKSPKRETLKLLDHPDGRQWDSLRTPKTMRRRRYPPEIEKALEDVKFIADHLKEETDDEQVYLPAPFTRTIYLSCRTWLH